MKSNIQKSYAQRLARYSDLLYGNDPLGLLHKMALYSALIEQHREHGVELWNAEPLLYHFKNSIEVDFHLSIAKLLEKPNRSECGLFAFLEFCEKNLVNISWPSGCISAGLIREQHDRLQTWQGTIQKIMSRRDKFFAHLDRKYFFKKSSIFKDFPLEDSEVINLATCVIKIIQEHQIGLNDSFSIHFQESYIIAVDNMVHKLMVGGLR